MQMYLHIHMHKNSCIYSQNYSYTTLSYTYLYNSSFSTLRVACSASHCAYFVRANYAQISSLN